MSLSENWRLPGYSAASLKKRRRSSQGSRSEIRLDRYHSEARHPVAKLCDLLDVAKSCYSTWSTGKVVPARHLEELRVVAVIKAAHLRGRGIYGAKKIQSELSDLVST